jgi:hypothetical protein
MILVTNETQVVENIYTFNKEVETYLDNNQDAPINTLVNNIPHYRAWYCIYDKESKTHLFAPSKYIGYKGMNASFYHKENTTGLDGRQTESVLANWYEQIPSFHPQYEDLSEKLRGFCSRFGKKPNSLFRISIVLETQEKGSIEGDVVDLIWKIYQRLTYDNKAILKAKINRLKV